MERAVRRYVRDWFVSRAKIPIACRRQNDVARSRRGGEMRDLYDAIGIVARESDLVRLVGRQILEFGNAEWITGAMGVAVSERSTRDHRGSAPAAAHFALSAGA